MIGYIIRRLATAVIVVLGVAAIIFALLHWLAPSPAYDVLGARAQPAAIASWNKQHGYDRGEIAPFLRYQANLVPLLRLRNTDVEVVEAVVDPRSAVTGSALREVDLPPESTIAVVIRNGSAFFPNGATVLEPGDEVVALTRGVHEPRLRSLFFSEQ